MAEQSQNNRKDKAPAKKRKRLDEQGSRDFDEQWKKFVEEAKAKEQKNE